MNLASSRSLLRVPTDSADFFEDAAVNFLIFMALAWSATHRARVGMALACVLLAPALAFLWALWSKLGAPAAPDPVKLALTGLGALVVNLTCAFLLARFKSHGGSLAKAAFLSAPTTCWPVWRSSRPAA